ncbi:hypothetical protein FOZ63_015161, partial [Perkinsus olseni]
MYTCRDCLHTLPRDDVSTERHGVVGEGHSIVEGLPVDRGKQFHPSGAVPSDHTEVDSRNSRDRKYDAQST